MGLAIIEAKKSTNEIPVGCIMVDKNGNVVSSTSNTVEKLKSPIMHAEIDCIKQTIEKTGEKFLNNYAMYVTLEPCMMCFGAICLSRVGTLFIGSRKDELKSINLLFNYNTNHKPDMYFDIMKQECDDLINVFFDNLR